MRRHELEHSGQCSGGQASHGLKVMTEVASMSTTEESCGSLDWQVDYPRAPEFIRRGVSVAAKEACQ